MPRGSPSTKPRHDSAPIPPEDIQPNPPVAESDADKTTSYR
jgi:hypothetical protein